MPFVQTTVFFIFSLFACCRLASAAFPIEARGPIRTGYDCGGHIFTKQEVKAADRAGREAWFSRPHEDPRLRGQPWRFPNNEGFEFLCEGPYLKFPILTSGEVYNGDQYDVRYNVIFNEEGQFGGVIYYPPILYADAIQCEPHISSGGAWSHFAGSSGHRR